MSQDYQPDRRKSQHAINFDDRRKIPYDYKKKFQWQPIIAAALVFILTGSIGFIGTKLVKFIELVNEHDKTIQVLISAAPSDQPQVVINSELKSEIEGLDEKLDALSYDFIELKGNQIDLQENVTSEFKELNKNINELSNSIWRIQYELGIEE
jgi:hypothetical protein